MEGSILLTYLTSSRESWEVAEVMAVELEKQGVRVDTMSARNVDSFDQYKMIIFGAPIHMFIWPKELHRFLTKHENAMKDLPIAVFSVGAIFKKEEPELEKARKQMDEALEKYSWMKPTAKKIFGIKLTSNDLPFPFNLFQKKSPVEEMMDWADLKAWVRGLVKA